MKRRLLACKRRPWHAAACYRPPRINAPRSKPHAACSRSDAMSEPSAPSATNKDPRSIAEYHAHVYYDAATTRGRAERLRQRVGAEFPQAKLGRWHDALVGPHTQSMYQIAFPSGMLSSFVPWLMLNRRTDHPPPSRDRRRLSRPYGPCRLVRRRAAASGRGFPTTPRARMSRMRAQALRSDKVSA
jgi:Dopa 4,5-dioxygenase family